MAELAALLIGDAPEVWAGLGFVVDARSTRRISVEHARMILDAPPGVDIYPSELRFEVDLRPR